LFRPRLGSGFVWLVLGLLVSLLCVSSVAGVRSRSSVCYRVGAVHLRFLFGVVYGIY